MNDIKNCVGLEEVKIVFILIVLHVWLVPKLNLWFAGMIFGLVVLSWWWHKKDTDTLKDVSEDLGLLPKHSDILVVFKLTFNGCLILFILGLLFNAQFPFDISLLWKFPKNISVYFFWAFLQQLTLNGFVANRLYAVVKNPMRVSLVSGILIAIIHLPNPVLVVITLIGGGLSAYLFITERVKNIYALAFGHACIAESALYFLPFAWHHGLNIGPNFLR